jgi:hypothetical protein
MMLYNRWLQFLISFFLCFCWSSQDALAKPTFSLSPHVKVYRVYIKQKHLIPTGLMIQNEIEQILSGIDQLTVISTIQLPRQYYLLRFSTPLVLPAHHLIGYPIKEVIITLPVHHWDRHRLLIKNSQNQWAEYQTSRPLSILVNQLEAWDRG